jgi:hypothetical protein
VKDPCQKFLRFKQRSLRRPKVSKVKTMLSIEEQAKEEADRNMSVSERDHQNQRVLKNVHASQGKSK